MAITINLDTNKGYSAQIPEVWARQGELDSEFLEVNLQQNGKDITWASIMNAAPDLYFETLGRRSQSRTIVYPSFIQGGKITGWTIPQQALTESGDILECYFRYEAKPGPNGYVNKRGSTSRFIMKVRPSATAVLSASYISEIQNLIDQINAMMAAANLDNLDQRLLELSNRINAFEAASNAHLEEMTTSLNNQVIAWNTTLTENVDQLNADLTAADVQWRADLAAKLEHLYSTLATAEADINAQVNTLTLRLENELTASDTALTEHMNNMTKLIQTQIDNLQAQIDAMNIQKIVLDTFSSPQVDALLREIAREEVTKQFETAGAVSIPIAQQMLGGAQGLTPAPELANTISNVLFANQNLIFNRVLDFKDKIYNSTAVNPHNFRYGSPGANIQSISLPSVGPWTNSTQGFYDMIKSLDGTFMTIDRLGSQTVPTPVAQGLVGIDATGEFKKGLPAYYPAGLTPAQEALITKSLIEQFSITVYAKSVAAGGSLKTTLTLFNGTSGEYGVNTTVTNAEIKPLTIASNNASTQAYVSPADGMIYFNIMANPGSTTVASTLYVDYITFTLRAKPKANDIFATIKQLTDISANSVNLAGIQTITGAKTFTAITKFKATNQNNIYTDFQNASGQRLAFVGFGSATATDYTIGLDDAAQTNGGFNVITKGTGTAKVNGQQIVDRGALAISDVCTGTELNVLTKNGTFRGNNLGNAPNNVTGGVYVENQVYDAAYQLQKAIILDSTTYKKVYVRRKVVNVWEPWWELTDYMYHPLVTNNSVELRKPQQNSARGISWNNKDTGAFEGGMGYQYGWVDGAEEPRSLYMGLGTNPWVDSTQGMRVNFVSKQLEAFNKGFITKNLTTSVLLEPLLFGAIARIRGAGTGGQKAIVMEAEEAIYLRGGVTATGVDGPASLQVGPTAADFKFNGTKVSLSTDPVNVPDATSTSKGLMTVAHVQKLDKAMTGVPLALISTTVSNANNLTTKINVLAEKYNTSGVLTHVRLLGTITSTSSSSQTYYAGQLMSLSAVLSGITTSGTQYGVAANTGAYLDGASGNDAGNWLIHFDGSNKIMYATKNHKIGAGVVLVLDTVIALNP